jgi:hypothetical protein
MGTIEDGRERMVREAREAFMKSLGEAAEEW